MLWKRGYSSDGRALAWHARGQRFDPAYLHHSCPLRLEAQDTTLSRWVQGCESPRGRHPWTGVVVQLVRIPACHAGGSRVRAPSTPPIKSVGIIALLPFLDVPLEYMRNDFIELAKRSSNF